MVLASLGAPRAGYYVIQDVCEMPERVDAGLLQRAWRFIAARHAALRTAIRVREGQPLGIELPEPPNVPWRELDGMALKEFLAKDRAAGFDFDSGPPMRFAILRTASDATTIVWTSHHALLDARSYTIVWGEWLEIYDSLVKGEEVAKRAPDVSRAPVIPDPGRAGEFWREYFDGVVETTDYIVDRLKPDTPPAEPVGRHTVQLSEERTRELHEFARDCGVTLNTMVQAAWAQALSRYSGRGDVVFGVTRSGRTPGSDDNAVGFFLNTLPLRVRMDSKAGTESWLKGIRKQWTALRDWDRTPLDAIQKWPGLPAGTPLFDSVLNYEHEPPIETLRRKEARWAGRTLERHQRTDGALTLAAYGSPTLTLQAIYDTKFFCAETINALLPDLRCFPNIAEDARPDFSPEPLSPLCAHELFEHQAARTPQHPALEFPGGALSYDELNRSANRLAWHLRDRGIGPEDRVAVCMHASPHAITAILAILKAGAAFVPIDPAFPGDRRAAMLATAQPKLVIDSLDGMKPDFEHQPDANLAVAAHLENAAYAIFTSGSTGTPKAVVVTHGGLANHTFHAPAIYGIDSTDRRLQFANVASDVFVAEIFNYLTYGATLVLGWDRANTSIRDFLDFLDRRRISITGLPSAWWHEWVAAIEHGNTFRPTALRAVIAGMEKINPAAYRSWKRTLGSSIRLFNAYGPTETSLTATIYEAGSSDWEREAFVPVGKPIPNTTVHVLDRFGRPVPAGVKGELFIGGLGVARGYLNAPEPAADRFLPDPFSRRRDARLYKTGDLGFQLPDGNLVFLGRRDRQVKVRGFRIELEEIETALAAHPAVKHCAVITLGEEGKRRVAAYFEPRDTAPSISDLHSHLSRRLPAHMIPQAFYLLSQTPLTPAGKIDYSGLPSATAVPLGDSAAYQAPTTATEKRLAEIWIEVLGASNAATPIGVADNLFERGASSLDTARLITMVEAQFGKLVEASSIWRAPTLGRMAALLDGASPAYEDAGAVVALQPKGSRPPFFCFPGADDNPYYFLALARSVDPDQPFYIVRDPRPSEERAIFLVEEAAGRFIEAIREVRPEGPYVVGGHCYGGIVAFEVARQLIALGERVTKVVMFEVAAPGYPKIVRHLPEYGKHALSILAGNRRVTAAEARGHLRVVAKVLRRRAETFQRRMLLRAGLKRVVEKRDNPKFHPNTQAGRTYAPKPIDCNVVQFIAADERHSTQILDDPRLGWREFTRGEFSALPTPGIAAEIFKQPHVRALASALSNLLAPGVEKARAHVSSHR